MEWLKILPSFKILESTNNPSLKKPMPQRNVDRQKDRRSCSHPVTSESWINPFRVHFLWGSILVLGAHTFRPLRIYVEAKPLFFRQSCSLIFWSCARHDCDWHHRSDWLRSFWNNENAEIAFWREIDRIESQSRLLVILICEPEQRKLNNQKVRTTIDDHFYFWHYITITHSG